MIAFYDAETQIKSIETSGISATDTRAESKMQRVMTHYVNDTQYRKGKIFSMVRKVAEDYFRSFLPEEVDEKLKSLYETAKNTEIEPEKQTKKKKITLYKSEMERIKQMEKPDLQRFCFAVLAIYKFNAQYTKDGEMKYLRWISGDFAPEIKALSIGGKVSNDRFRRLEHLAYTNGMYKFGIYNLLFTKYHQQGNGSMVEERIEIPFAVERILMDEPGREDLTNEDNIYFVTSNYADIMSVLDAYITETKVEKCSCCDEYFIKKIHNKKYCPTCAKNQANENAKASVRRCKK